MTNYERINAMGIDEMAELFTEKMGICPDGDLFCNEDCLNGQCEKCIKNWLEREVEEL